MSHRNAVFMLNIFVKVITKKHVTTLVLHLIRLLAIFMWL